MSQREVNTTAALVFASILILCLATVLLVRCATRPDDITPTLAISETPSITPEATATATPTSSPLPATGTAVDIIPPATATIAAPTVMPSPTPTLPPPTMTTLPPTTTDERLLIKPGTTYWQEAKNKYGLFEAWQCLKVVNGWPERALPVGDYMRLPEGCE